jgi:hypothetical protein
MLKRVNVRHESAFTDAAAFTAAAAAAATML